MEETSIDYRKEIIKMVKEIKSERILKLIYGCIIGLKK